MARLNDWFQRRRERRDARRQEMLERGLEAQETGEVALTRIACRLLDDSTCRCGQYATRHQFVRRLLHNLQDALVSEGLPPRVSTSHDRLLVQLPASGARAPMLAESLRGEGILIRDCSNFSGLDDRYIRLAVRTAGENKRLLAALRQVLAQDD